MNVVETRIVDGKLCKIYKTNITDGDDQNIPDQCYYMFTLLNCKIALNTVKNMRWEILMSLAGLGISIHYEQETGNTENN